MNGNFFLYLYYLWHCLIYVNIQAEREKEFALKNPGGLSLQEKASEGIRLNHVLYKNRRQLQQRYSRITHMENKLVRSYHQGQIDTLEMKSRRVLLERARKKCNDLDSFLNKVDLNY